jgi:hypothetical protein
MSDPERPSFQDPDSEAASRQQARARWDGASVDVRPSVSAPLPPVQNDFQSLRPAAPAPEHALARPAQPAPRAQQSSGFQRAMGALRMVLPVVQKVLPLLDGNIASAVSNILGTRPQGQAQSANLAPVENALSGLQAEQRELRSQVAAQNASLKQVADQLTMVKEATDRNTLEQQELMDDLAGIRRKVKVFAWAGLSLLVLSIAVNVFLFLHIQRILP